MAVEQVLDAEVAWVADPAPGPSKALAHRHPGVPNLGDITLVNWATVPPVDIIDGGSPCQDLSTAGRRAGMTDGTRSNLWVIMREAIAHVRPKFVVWENVRGALSAVASSGLESCPGCVGDGAGQPALRALGRVVGDLADLGYDAQWTGLRVSDLGGCHHRFRVFLLAFPADAERLQQRDATERGLRPEPRDGAGVDGLTVLRTPTAQLAINGGSQHPDKRRAGGHGPTLADEVEHLLPTPAASNPNDGEGVDTWLARRERVKATANNGNGMGTPLSIAVQMIPTPSVADAAGGHERRGGARGDELLLKGLAKEGHLSRFGDYAPAIASHERLAGRPAPSPTEPGRNGQPRLSPRFAEWMMCLSDGHVTDVPGVTRSEQLALLGNGVCPPQAAAALNHLLATPQGGLSRPERTSS